MVRGRFGVAGIAACLLLLHACGENAVEPPKPAALRFVVAPSSAAETLKPLAVQPSVEVVDASGNTVPTAGMVITAAVVTGNGQIIAGGSAQTAVDGIAAFQNLTLGASSFGEVGAVTLQFTTADGFQITSPVELACPLPTPILGGTVTDALVDGDCSDSNGRRGKVYALTVVAPTKAIRVRQRSAAFSPSAQVRAANDPLGHFFGWSGFPDEVTFTALIPPGIVHVRASATGTFAAGPFTLEVTSAAEDPVICAALQFHSPVATTQTLTSACRDNSLNIGDALFFLLVNGARIDAVLSSSAFNPFAAVFEVGATTPVTSATASGSSVSVTFTNQTGSARLYYIFAGSATGSGTGEYTLQATITNPSGSALTMTSGTFLGSILPHQGRYLSGGPVTTKPPAPRER
jgi:hypothetical protein